MDPESEHLGMSLCMVRPHQASLFIMAGPMLLCDWMRQRLLPQGTHRLPYNQRSLQANPSTLQVIQHTCPEAE